MNAEVERQVSVISSGAAEILPEDGLVRKVERSLKDKKPLTVKLGVDPTAPDLHLGHAVPLRKLRQFQDLGHKAVLIIGDFTALVGDPSGRSATRPTLTPEQVAANAKTYTDQAFKILLSDSDRLEIRCNSSWLASLRFAEIMELTAKFTVAGLLVRDDFMKRYKSEQPIGLHEFLYPVMQAYDSVEIRADIELGGTDQRFNLLAGRELQEKFGQEPQTAVCLPLLEGTDGLKKMSKSYGNHIGLTFDPVDMFGKVMSIPDEGEGQPRFSLIIRYYQLALGSPPRRVKELAAALQAETLDPRDAKEELAFEIVSTYHGRAAAEAAKADFDSRFRKKDLSSVREIAEKVSVPADLRNENGLVFMPKLLSECGAASSMSEGRRLIQQNGVRVEGRTITDFEHQADDEFLLEVGKRKKLLISFADWPERS